MFYKNQGFKMPFSPKNLFWIEIIIENYHLSSIAWFCVRCFQPWSPTKKDLTPEYNGNIQRNQQHVMNWNRVKENVAIKF